MRVLYLLSVGLHILAVAVWVGGMLFLSLALVPVMRQEEYRSVSASLVRSIGLRFRKVGWASLWLLILTGFLNLFLRGFDGNELLDPLFWTTPFGIILRTKLLFVGLILILSGVHDFYVGPRATLASIEDPTSEEAVKLRRQASWIGRWTLLLALVIVALGIILSRGGG